jgi:hypothetical protein
LLPKFSAVTKLDDDVAASLLSRTERRRHALTVLVSRLNVDDERKKPDLIDLLFALTGFDMFWALSVRNRSAESIEALIQDLVEQTMKRFRSPRSTKPRRRSAKRTRVLPHER